METQWGGRKTKRHWQSYDQCILQVAAMRMMGDDASYPHCWWCHSAEYDDGGSEGDPDMAEGLIVLRDDEVALCGGG